MDFYEVLEQALDLLRRRGRVAYRALKLQFNLDDEQLAALKDELIHAQKLAADEDDRVLVWTGTAAAPPAPGQPFLQPAPQPAPQEDHTAPGPLPSAGASPLGAERRQLTVMFCDVADSTALSHQIDPEDYREVIRAYQAACTEVVQHFEGYIAQYLGDGLLVYFGYPVAHEDDAVRAVHAGLGILDAIGTLHARLAQDKSIGLVVRIGIHTGLVVVGEIGGNSRQERLALGETPNIAARLQSLATPGRVVLSEQTQRLVGGMFDYDNVTTHVLKGLADTVRVYWVHGASAAESRFEAATASGLTPLVGRDGEIDLLLRRWEQAREGEGQVVLLAGEAGIGKSRITQALREHLCDEPHLRLRAQCLPYYSNSAFYPFIAHLERAMACERDAPPTEKLDALEALLARAGTPLEEMVVPLFAALLSIASGDRYAPLTLSPQRQKDKTIEALIDQVRGLAQQQPVLNIFEDVHWIDPTSLEALTRLIDRLQDARVLLIITHRPEFTPPWGGFSHVSTHTLNRLSRRQVATMVQQITGSKTLPQEVLDQIVARTDGVPLFVEELTKTVLESGLLKDDGERYTLAGPLPLLAIPNTLQDSLLARLDRLGSVKEVAQLGAALGREFSYELLAAVSPLSDAELQVALHQLVQAELVFCRGQSPEATYLFKHALVQDAAYGSLLKSTRQRVHQQIAQVIEASFPALVETQPELVAQHYTAAGCTEQAVVYWQRAGQQASDRSANLEAISHCTIGIELLKTLPETPEHTQQALTLYISLGVALLMTKGPAAPEVEHAYTQARALCQQVGETPELAPVLLGLWRFYLARPQLHTARDIGETLLRLAQRAHDPALAVIAHYTLGATWMWLGALPIARQHLKEGIALYTPDQRHTRVFRIGQDPGVACRALAAQTLWLLGYPEQALVCRHEALALAHELSHPYSLAFARVWAAIVSQLRRDILAVHEQAEATVVLSTEQGFTLWAAWGTSLHGLVLAMQGQEEAGTAQIRQGIAAWRATGAALGVPYFCTLLAEVADHLGHPADSLQALAEAHTLVEQQDERWWEAEICRLRGILLLRQTMPQPEEAEIWLQRALDVARHQQAKSLELRAAMSLSRLWQQQGKRDDARRVLAEVYGWFTEGFDTADLQEARALLDELA
jgi:class 3 adenylate cyclase/predicted ATPase